MSHQCPKCDRVIYNRRSKICGFCGAELPAELLFTQAQIEALDRNAAEADARHKRQRDEEEAEAKAKAEEQARRTQAALLLLLHPPSG